MELLTTLIHGQNCHGVVTNYGIPISQVCLFHFNEVAHFRPRGQAKLETASKRCEGHKLSWNLP